MKQKKIDVESLSNLLNISYSQTNYKILKQRFTLQEILKIMELFNLNFEEIFIKE